MKYGIVLPFFDAADTADSAVKAEQAGWDGIFLAESVWGVDAWLALTAAAMRTERVRLGTMLTPVPRIKPWDLASRVGTLDRLSGGRVQLAAGLGAIHPGWTAFEPDSGRRDRALLLDEGLAIYDGLMRGQPFSFTGERYTVRPTDFYPPPPPVQQPRPPVWVVGAYPRRRSLARAARWDGLLCNIISDAGTRGPESPDELATVVTEVKQLRAEAGHTLADYDVVAEGVTPDDPDESGTIVKSWAEAGATWWIESNWSVTGDVDGRALINQRIEAGPPRW